MRFFCAEQACLIMAGSKDTSVEEVTPAVQLSLLFMLCVMVLLEVAN